MFGNLVRPAPPYVEARVLLITATARKDSARIADGDTGGEEAAHDFVQRTNSSPVSMHNFGRSDNPRCHEKEHISSAVLPSTCHIVADRAYFRMLAESKFGSVDFALVIKSI